MDRPEDKVMASACSKARRWLKRGKQSHKKAYLRCKNLVWLAWVIEEVCYVSHNYYDCEFLSDLYEIIDDELLTDPEKVKAIKKAYPYERLVGYLK